MEPRAKNRMVLVIVSLVAVTVGLFAGQHIPEDFFDFANLEKSETQDEETSSSDTSTKEDGDEEGIFVVFGTIEGKDAEAEMVPDRIIVNLRDPSQIVTLNTMITLQTDAGKDKKVEDAVSKRRPILKSWLTAYLSDKTKDEVSGKAAQNRMRREITDEFNRLLFEGEEPILDVHFEEFYVQE